jgi:hypothetical protein
MLTEDAAVDLMHKGRPLMKMHMANSVQWFTVPGGRVSDDIAGRILARPDARPHDSGLFSGCEQTFVLCGDE